MGKWYTENSQTRRRFYQFVVAGADEKIYSTTDFMDCRAEPEFFKMAKKTVVLILCAIFLVGTNAETINKYVSRPK